MHKVVNFQLPTVVIFTLPLTSALVFAGCAHNSARDNATVVGAGLGGLAGAAVSDADPLVTVGGAAIGGLLGCQRQFKIDPFWG